MTNVFSDIQPAFYRYMITFGGIAPKTARDYISRLKFLSKQHLLDFSLTSEKIDEILCYEEVTRTGRNILKQKSYEQFQGRAK